MVISGWPLVRDVRDIRDKSGIFVGQGQIRDKSGTYGFFDKSQGHFTITLSFSKKVDI